MSKQIYYNNVKLYINFSKSILNMLPNYIQASIYSNRELTFIINKNYKFSGFIALFQSNFSRNRAFRNSKHISSFITQKCKRPN